MAPISRTSHLLGMGAFAVVYGVLRTALLFGVVAAFLDVSFRDPQFVSASLVLLVSSVSFHRHRHDDGGAAADLTREGHATRLYRQGLLLVVSGVYYPVTVLPDWMQWISVISPATYTLEGCRAAILNGAGPAAVWQDIWPLLVIGTIAVPLGLAVFRRGERYAKQHGRLKRSG